MNILFETRIDLDPKASGQTMQWRLLSCRMPGAYEARTTVIFYVSSKVQMSLNTLDTLAQSTRSLLRMAATLQARQAELMLNSTSRAHHFPAPQLAGMPASRGPHLPPCICSCCHLRGEPACIYLQSYRRANEWANRRIQ